MRPLPCLRTLPGRRVVLRVRVGLLAPRCMDARRCGGAGDVGRIGDGVFGQPSRTDWSSASAACAACTLINSASKALPTNHSEGMMMPSTTPSSVPCCAAPPARATTALNTDRRLRVAKVRKHDASKRYWQYMPGCGVCMHDREGNSSRGAGAGEGPPYRKEGSRSTRRVGQPAPHQTTPADPHTANTMSKQQADIHTTTPCHLQWCLVGCSRC